MKTALYVLNIGGGSLCPKSRKSFQHAAKRWGMEYNEVLAPIRKGVHHYWQKTFVIDHAKERGYNRVLQLDADMLIRSDAPNPMNIVPETRLGVVSAHQCLQDGWIRGRMNAVRKWAERLGMECPMDERHLNGGFFLYNTTSQMPLFKEWQEIGKKYDYSPAFLPEQASLSVLLWNKPDYPVVWLPHRWNVVGAQQRLNLLGPEMKGYIYHFTGGDKMKRIRATWWNHTPKKRVLPWSEAIVKRLPQGECVMAEVGVLRGVNASGVLHLHPDVNMYLVDNWQQYDKRSDYVRSEDGNSKWTTDDWKLILHEALERLDWYYGRWRLIQLDSLTASRVFENKSLDMVFIDACHSEGAVSADIQAWWPKVKDGGWLGGHDYGVLWNGLWGVKEAVDKFVELEGLVLETDAGCWFVKKPGVE